MSSSAGGEVSAVDISIPCWLVTGNCEENALLSIVIPVRNGASLLEGTVEAVLQFLDKHDPAAGGELIVVSDGCVDAPETVLESVLSKDSRLRLERLDRSRGKGAAVRHGVLVARGEQIVFLDVDLSAQPQMIARLLAALDAGADLACGSRHQAGSKIEISQGIFRAWLGALFRFLVRMTTRLQIGDTQCGCKAFQRDQVAPIFEQMVEEGFAFDIELLLEARRRGLVIEEVPIEWADGESSSVRPIRDGLKMLLALLRLTIRDRFRSDGFRSDGFRSDSAGKSAR